MSADVAAPSVDASQRSFGQLALRLRVSGVVAFLILLARPPEQRAANH